MSHYHPKESDSILTMRSGLRDKLMYFWGDTFQDLYAILRMAEDVPSDSLMHATDVTMSTGNTYIRIHEELGYNASMILTEIIDDYWAALNCFLHGFTKQSQTILRG